MKTVVFVLVLAAVLAVANCAPYQIAVLVPEEHYASLAGKEHYARVARSPQFGGTAANAGAQLFSGGEGGSPKYSEFSGYSGFKSFAF